MKGCSQPSKSDQVPDLGEKVNLTQKSQVPELNETHLVEGKKDLQNADDCHGDNHFCLLSNMMEDGIWSILTDTLHYVKPEIDSSVIYSCDQKMHQNSKSKYFDAAFSNIPNENNNHSVDYTYNAKEENFDAANYNVPNVPVYSKALFPKYEGR